MSKIDKLAILGVRSFDNQRSETIQFYTPLTLIVGLNGSGKTTIVEALKYATCGDLPPNSRGGAFIHDPKLCGEKEVLAQVRFSFVSTTGARMVATRNLQLTVKKTTRSQKTLEGSLLMVKDGERTVISSRVAELDQILPQYLGVSRAVLDNVIFCHQDESLWPLSEPSVLKRKFDEIFEAMKYTKAIENIRQLRKKQNEELAKFRLTEQHAKENKERADKAERRSRELSDEIESLRDERDVLHQRSTELETKAEEAWDNAARFTEIVEALKSARQKRDWHEAQRDKLLVDLEERNESDEQLNLELEQSEAREAAQHESRTQKAKQKEDITKEMERVRGLQSKRRIEAGRLEQQKASHEAKLREREAAIKAAAREQNIHGYDMELDDVQIGEFIERISKLSKAQTARVERAANDHALETQKVQEVIDQLREKRSTLLQSKNSAKDLIATNEKRLTTAHKELESLDIDDVSRNNIESNIADLQSKLQSAKQRLTESDTSGSIREANKQLQALDIDISSLNRELIDSTKHAGELARLEHLQKEVKDRQRNIQTLRATYGERLTSLIGKEWNTISLDKDFFAAMESKREQVSAAERERDDASRQLEQLEYKLKLTRSELKKKRSEMQTSAQAVKELAEVEAADFPEAMAGAELDRDTIRADLDNFANMNKYFQEAIDIVTKHNQCRLCRRAFEDQRASATFVDTLKKLVSLKQQEKLQEQLKEIEEYLPKCRDAGTNYDTWRRLSEKEIPALEQNEGTYEEERQQALTLLDERERVAKDKEDARREVETLSKPVTNITKCHTEIDDFEEQIRGLAAKQASSVKSRTLDELHAEIESLNGQAKEQRSQLAKLQQEEQGLRSQVSALEIEHGAEKARLVKADHELEKRGSISTQIIELKAANQTQRDMIANVEQELASLGSRMDEETMRMDDLKARHKQNETEVQRAATRLLDTQRELERIHRDVRQHEEAGGTMQLARCQREIESFDKEIEGLAAESRGVQAQLDEIAQELNQKDRSKRVIADNLNYRAACRELAEVQAEIEKLAGANAEADQAAHRRVAQRLQKEHQEVVALETSKVERMKVKDDQLFQLLEDWKTDYADAAANYKRVHIEVATTKAAVDDLGRYGSALDQAIMKYHTLKMEEINSIIEELWRRTYQGTDVDTIRIRSDSDSGGSGASASAATSRQSNYHYRVCMVKQDVEMDMRGRCSAGQRVLASILIRLALAECFGVHCGLIALDEPTTNLDRDNIVSLAESLHHIIRQRRQQRNFQLIIITHDEDFLRAIRPGEFCDHYYRVSRSDRQKSIIERQSIAEVL